MAESGLHDRQTVWHRYFLTLTAPGFDGLHGRFHAATGGYGRLHDCGQHWSDLAAWNADAGRTWNRLRTALRRDHPTVEFMRVAEVQRRGAIHHHVLLASLTPLDIAAVQELALAAGYGCQFDLQPITGTSAAAADYACKAVAGYVSKAVDSRELVPWRAEHVDTVTGEITETSDPTFRTWSASRGWGLTMRAIREALRQAREKATANTTGTAELQSPRVASSLAVIVPAPDSG